MKKPKVVIIMATYNGARYLPAQLASLAAQTHRPDQLVIRDDGSTDGSVHLVCEWGAAEGIEVNVVAASARLGPALSFLVALRSAELADVYLFCDQDDVWLPHKVADAIQALSAEPHDAPHLYATRLEIVDEHLRPLRLSPLPTVLAFESAACESVLTGCTMAINAALATRLRDKLPQSLAMHDWWTYLIASGCGQVSFNPLPSVLYRQHSANTLGAGPHGFTKMRARVVSFFGPKTSERSEQLRELLRLHRDGLTPGAAKLATMLTEAQENFTGRLYAAFVAPVRRQSRWNTLFTRLSLLTGRF